MEKWKLYAIISMLFAGLTSVIAKFGMKNLSSDVALSIRTLVVFSHSKRSTNTKNEILKRTITQSMNLTNLFLNYITLSSILQITFAS